MIRLLAFTIPGQDTPLVPPDNIPDKLKGGLSTSGQPLIQLGVNLLFWLVMVAAVVMILYSGIRMITSQGDSAKLADARKQLTYSIIGLVVTLGAFFIIHAVLTIFGGNYGYFFADFK